MQVWTVQLSNWRKVKEEGITLLDITAKSGKNEYAPEFSNVMKYKNGELSEKDYTDLYLKRMELSKIRFPYRWKTLTEYSKVALACYCKPDAFCHRLLFLNIMEEYLKDYNISITRMGELRK